MNENTRVLEWGIVSSLSEAVAIIGKMQGGKIINEMGLTDSIRAANFFNVSLAVWGWSNESTYFTLHLAGEATTALLFNLAEKDGGVKRLYAEIDTRNK